MKKNIKIYVCHHKNTATYENNYIIPIQAGRAISDIKLNMLGDDTGDNISFKNKSWCELTVIYWMWKNIDADYYGLFHYRRFLNFKSIGGGYELFHEFNNINIDRFGWNEKDIETLCYNYDIISSPVWNIHPIGLPNKLMTNYEFYNKEHFGKDLDLIIDIIKNKYPNIYPYALRSLYSKECFFANMLIMNKKYFNEYCNWVFDILFEAEKRIDISNYDSYQYRIWGFLAERLSNCFIEYVKARDENLRYTTLGMVFGVFDKYLFNKNIFENNIIIQKSRHQDFFSKDTINIVFAIDDNYVKHCATVIESILDFINIKQKIRFFILYSENNLSYISQSLLSNFDSEYIDIEFIKVNAKDFKIYPLNRAHISIATYYRLAIHKLLPENIDKVIYLDADLLVLDNIANLWNEDISDYVIAGAPDEGGISQIRRLNLAIQHNYINAGVCVMNLKKMRQLNLDHLYIESLYKNYDLITLQDQDILNITFEKNIKRLHVKWNIQSRMFKYNELEYSYKEKELKEAMENPGIIHYSDSQKPWQLSSRHPVKYLFKMYESRLSKEWDSINKYTQSSILDFISYEVKGDKVIVFMTIKDIDTSFSINKKFAKAGFKIFKLLLKLSKKVSR